VVVKRPLIEQQGGEKNKDKIKDRVYQIQQLALELGIFLVFLASVPHHKRTVVKQY
jgi:hypothetical protein